MRAHSEAMAAPFFYRGLSVGCYSDLERGQFLIIDSFFGAVKTRNSLAFIRWW